MLCWRHPHNEATLWRSSQPQVGLSGNHSMADEHFLRAVVASSANASQIASGTERKLVVVDCRPKVNAMANKVKGGGVESVSRHSGQFATGFIGAVYFMNIANIHSVRGSLESLHKLANSTKTDDMKWGSKVEDTQWLVHIRSILQAGVRMAKAMSQKAYTILCHCSDGWDRTSQLCALSMLLQDSYFRTPAGFLTLIEKEWLGAGHKFQDRIGEPLP